MAEGFLSTQVCECGCDIRMPAHLVALGWRFLRGHKPKELRPAASTTPITDRKMTLQTRSFSYADIVRLTDVEIPALEEQQRVWKEQRDQADAALELVEFRLSHARTMRTLAREITGDSNQQVSA